MTRECPAPFHTMASISRPQFRALFLAQRDRLFRMLLRLAGNAHDAEDLLQETFLVVWRKRGDFEGRGAPEGYLRTTAVRLFLNRKQAQAARPRTSAELHLAEGAGDPDQPCPSKDLASREAMRFLVDRVELALNHLSPEQRHAFVLFRYEGMKVKEIAELTETLPKTVETRIRRATIALAAELRPFRHLLPAS